MKLYFSNIADAALTALTAKGLELGYQQGEHVLLIPDEEWQSDQWLANDKKSFTLRGITVTRKQQVFNGRVDAPTTFSTLEDDMVPSGVDGFQCDICGRWMDRKMTVSDEKQHDYYCRPQFQWQLA